MTRTLATVALALLVGLLPVGCGKGIEDQLAAARSHQDEGRLEESIEPLREVLAELPEHPEANYLLGYALLRTGRLTPAIWPLRKAAESDEFGAMAGQLLAHALLSSGNYEQAREVAGELLERQPGDLQALKLRGQASMSARRFEDMLADGQQILEAEPNDALGQQLVVVALTELERWDEAETVLLEMREAAAAAEDTELGARACIALATVHEKSGDSAAAEQAFQSCVESFPSNPLVISEVANYHLRREQPKLAETLWREAAERFPDSLPIRLGLAGHLEARGDIDGAKVVLRSAAEDFGSAQAWEALAELHRREGDFATAADILEKALAGGVASERLEFKRADILVDAGNLELAETLSQNFTESAFRDFIRGRLLLERGDARGAFEALESGLVRWPDNAAARAAAGRAAQEIGDSERALEHYRQALRADSNATDVAYAAARLAHSLGRFAEAAEFARSYIIRSYAADRPIEGTEPLVLAINAARDAGQETEALEYEQMLANRARRSDPLAVAALARLERQRNGPEAAIGVIEKADLDLTDAANESALREQVDALVQQGKAAQALTSVDRALARDADVPQLHDLRARVLAALDRRDDAQAAFERALEIDPKHAPSLAGLGALRVQAGDLPGALEQYDRAEAADPRDVESAYRAAQIVLARGDRADAEKRLRSVVVRAPEHPGASNDLAWLLADSGRDLDLALDLAKRSVRASPPAAADSADTLAFVQLARNDAEGAVETLEPAVAEHPESGMLRYRLGLARAKLGDEQAALAAFRDALEDQSFTDADAARAQIARLEAEGAQ